MKKLIYLFALSIGAVGCSVESIDSTENLTVADFSSKNKDLNSLETTEDPMGIYSGKNLKGTVEIFHDCEYLYIKLTPTGDDPEGVKLGIFRGEDLPDENGYSGEMQYDLSHAKDLTWSFNIEEEEYDVEEDLNIFFTAWGGDWIGTSTLGNKNNAPNYHEFQFDFSEMDCSCEESFSYEANEDGSYTFTYVSEEDVTNALLVYTFAQGVAVDGLEGFTRNGNETASTWSSSMDLKACEIYSWTVSLDRICGGVGQPNANVWTDFKVNENSKKGDLENIRIACSI